MAIDNSQQLKLISQSLAAAKNSLDLAQQLLGDLSDAPQPAVAASTPRPLINLREGPGILGFFDGENLVTPTGGKYKVPENYASKTGVVFGDKLKIIDPPVGQAEPPGGKIFKQIERVKRQRVEGVLAKSEKGWKLVTADGSCTVLEAAVKHFGGKEGTEMYGLLPKDSSHAPFAALEGLVKPPLSIPTVEGKEEGRSSASPKPTKPIKASTASGKKPANVKKESKKPVEEVGLMALVPDELR